MPDWLRKVSPFVLVCSFFSPNIVFSLTEWHNCQSAGMEQTSKEYGKSKFSLCLPEVLEGTDYTMVASFGKVTKEEPPVNKETSYKSSSYVEPKTFYSNELTNYLFINNKTAEYKWLINNQGEIFFDNIKLYDSIKEDDKDKKVKAVLYYFYKGESPPSYTRPINISISSSSGSSYTTLIEGISIVYGVLQVSPETFLILYKKGGEIYSGIYSIDSFKLLFGGTISKQ